MYPLTKLCLFWGFGPEYDRIYAEETNQLLVSIPLNSIEGLTNDNVVSFEILNSNSAEKVYNAVRNYSNVEWAMIKHGKEGSSTLLNEHNPTAVESELLYKYEKEDGPIIMTHNHVPVSTDVNDPGFYFESSKGKVPRSMPSKEDFDTAKKHPKVIFRQTYKNSPKVNHYDGDGLK